MSNFWIISFTTPIYKSGCRNNIVNYRPISIISTIPKLFETFLIDYLYSYLIDFIIPEQHGFIRGRSVETNLMGYTQYLLSSLDKGYQVDTIFMDLSKAFDRVNHDILIQKLRSIGVSNPLLSWLQTYLTNRKQSH